MKQVELDHFKHFKMPGSLRASGRGELAFLLRQANVEENRYDSDLWLWRGGEALRLTAGAPVVQFWWRDNATLLLVRREEGKKEEKSTTLCALSVDAPGEAAPFLTLPYEVEDLAFLCEDRFVFLAPEGGDRLPHGGEARDKDDYQVVTELPIWENGEGFTGGRRRRLYLWQEGEAKALLGEDWDAEQLRLSRDGRHAYCIAKEYRGVMPLFNRLLQIDLESLAVRDISVSEAVEHTDYALLESGGLVVFANDMKSYGINQNAAFYRVDPQGGSTLLYDGGQYGNWSSVGCDVTMGAPPVWQAADDTVYWITTIGDSSHLMTIDAGSGAITQLTTARGAVPEFALGGGQLFFTGLRGLYGPELYTLVDGAETRLSAFNAALPADYAYSPPEGLFFENRRGARLRGWAMRPPGLREGEKCPTILTVHGGPKTVYGPVLFHEMQYWAGLGFGVIYCNPTGSDGGGDAFADLRGRYGEIDYDDLMRFVDVALDAHPWIDEERLGVTGGSYGGFMTNWMIGHTGRFAAAASQRSISNWTTMSLTADIGYYFEPDQTGTDPWQNPTALWDGSPLKYADRVTTPTLFVHSDEDYRCPLPEALQMYTALKIHGVETRLCIFHGENHDLSRGGKPRHRIARLREISAWFEEHLMGKRP